MIQSFPKQNLTPGFALSIKTVASKFHVLALCRMKGRPVPHNASTIYRENCFSNSRTCQILSVLAHFLFQTTSSQSTNKKRHFHNGQRQNYCHPLSIHRQSIPRSQQKLVASIYWITSWYRAWLIHHQKMIKIVYNPLYLDPSSELSRHTTSRSRQQFDWSICTGWL